MASGFNPLLTKPKALPPLSARADELPPPPPSPNSSGPPPPPKMHASPSGSYGDDGSPLEPPPPHRDALSPPGFLTPPGSPAFSSGSSSMLGPPSPTAPDGGRPKKVNPFVDLMETEKVYVDTLSGIIRKVAAAWSRSNLPPPELDMMFRSVEAIFKANRSFQSKLKEIGPNPSSPRAIGDLLMKWIDQLDAPYTKYCSSFLYGFDEWEPVQSNQRLPPVLESFSASLSSSDGTIWTLDKLFSLPRARIKYYQKLYGRLLKSSTPGKSTDQKLLEAVERLESLLNLVDDRANVPLPGPSHVHETTDEVVIDTREVVEDVSSPPVPVPEKDRDYNRISSEPKFQHQGQNVRSSAESSARGSSLSSGQSSSRDTAMTSEGRASLTAASVSMSDLERRLSTERCQDLFTMTPRNVRLSINSPNLPYTRELRLSEDTAVHFTPKATNNEVIHRQGHVFLLTDLFLVCEHISMQDRARSEPETADMWLCYPPLAAKHLRVAPIENTGMEVTILKREVMQLYFASSTKRDSVLREFKATAELAAALPPPSKTPPPPLPSLNTDVAPPGRRPSDPPNDYFSPPRSLNVSPRSASPATGDPSMHRMDPARNLSNDSSPPISGPGASNGGPPPYSPSNDSSGPPSRMASPPGPRPVDPPSFIPGQFVPPPRGESSRGGPPHGMAPMGLPQRPNMMRDSPPHSFSPGQVLPPQRSDSGRAPPPMGGMQPMRNGMSPPPMNGMNGPPRSMMSPPPMNAMTGGPPQGGPYGGPQRSGSMGPQGPPLGGLPMGGPGPRPGPGPGPGAMFPGQGPMRGQPGMGPGPYHNQQLPPHPNPPFANPGRPSSDPNYQGGVRKTPSLHSLGSQHDSYGHPPRSAPPVPNMPNGFPSQRENSWGSAQEQPGLRPMLPSAALPRIASAAPAFRMEESPPPSPTEAAPLGPVESSVLATMKCKVFLQQQHAQWKALGSSKLMLYEQRPTMIKQLVVEADNKDKTILISTIVLTDGVERVGKTGVAIELSDAGARTGIIYMIQLRNEKSAGGFYEMLLSGSDRGGFRG